MDEPVPQSAQGDATRRTHLANERTYLAWWRTGLTALAVGVGIGKLVPQVANEQVGAISGVAGIGFSLLGIFFIGYATKRARAVRRALEQGTFSHPDPRVFLGLAVAGGALGVLTLVVVVRAL